MNDINQDYWFPSDESIRRYLSIDIEEKRRFICGINIQNLKISDGDRDIYKTAANVVISLIVESTRNILKKHCI